MSIESVQIGFAPMCCERFKEIFYDRCPKDRIPELLKYLPDADREAFEAYLKTQADREQAAAATGLTPIEYDPIPCNADVLVFFENDQTATWSAVINAAGQVAALIDTHGNRYTSMAALHDHKITAFTLELEHTVGVPTISCQG